MIGNRHSSPLPESSLSGGGTSRVDGKAQGRYIFLDVLRGLAVLWMIETHITGLLLAPGEKANIWYNLLNISNGFIAPCFIFCAGAGLWIALSRKGDAFLSGGKELWGYLRRLAYILFWAYMLHVPMYSMQWILGATSQQLVPWLMIDVLQTIVYASLIALAVFFVVRNVLRTSFVLLAFLLAIMFFTRTVWDSKPFEYLPTWLAVAITPDVSPFPLLPWIGYFFAGFSFTHVFMRVEDKRKLAFRLLALCITVPIVLFMIKRAVHPGWGTEWWHVSPQLILLRVAGVVGVWSLIYLFEEDLKKGSIGSLMQTLGKESLFLYLSHVMIVYSALGPIVVAATGSSTVGYAGIALCFVLLTTPLALFALWWHGLKDSKPVLARRILTVQVAWMILSLLLTPSGWTFQDLFK